MNVNNDSHTCVLSFHLEFGESRDNYQHSTSEHTSETHETSLNKTMNRLFALDALSFNIFTDTNASSHSLPSWRLAHLVGVVLVVT